MTPPINPEQPFSHEGREQPFNQIITVALEDGRVVEHSIEDLPEDAFSEEPFETEKPEPEQAEREQESPPNKIHPVLRAMIDERPEDREFIVINLRDDIRIPRFPNPVIEEPPGSEANMEVARQTEELITEIKDRRAESYEHHSWKVGTTAFDPTTKTCTGKFLTSAIVKAFQQAVNVGDRVICTAISVKNTGYFSAESTAADNAWDAGAAVFACNGNSGPAAGTVEAPANAHKAIGVGNFDVQTLNLIPGQSRGPTGDGRIKPDIQAPTNTETASNTGQTDLGILDGTSGAVPYAAGAATLVRRFLNTLITPVDPGQVYAYLISSGQAFSPQNTTGAGRIVLPTNGSVFFGKTAPVNNKQTVNIPLIIAAGFTRLIGAIWWPERSAGVEPVVGGWVYAVDAHSDYDLHLVDPSGTIVAASISINSVFERVRTIGTIAAGVWTLRIRGDNVPFPRNVYYAANVS